MAGRVGYFYLLSPSEAEHFVPLVSSITLRTDNIVFVGFDAENLRARFNFKDSDSQISYGIPWYWMTSAITEEINRRLNAPSLSLDSRKLHCLFYRPEDAETAWDGYSSDEHEVEKEPGLYDWEELSENYLLTNFKSFR